MLERPLINTWAAVFKELGHATRPRTVEILATEVGQIEPESGTGPVAGGVSLPTAEDFWLVVLGVAVDSKLRGGEQDPIRLERRASSCQRLLVPSVKPR